MSSITQPMPASHHLNDDPHALALRHPHHQLSASEALLSIRADVMLFLSIDQTSQHTSLGIQCVRRNKIDELVIDATANYC